MPYLKQMPGDEINKMEGCNVIKMEDVERLTAANQMRARFMEEERTRHEAGLRIEKKERREKAVMKIWQKTGWIAFGLLLAAAIWSLNNSLTEAAAFGGLAYAAMRGAQLCDV